MKKKLFKKLLVLVFALVLIMPVAVSATAVLDTGLNYGSNTGLGNRDPRDIAASVINIMLGFLGIIAVVIILLGGFKWMTAGGNEDKVAEAKKLIGAGVVGLVIVLAAFGIASFVVTNLMSATT